MKETTVHVYFVEHLNNPYSIVTDVIFKIIPYYKIKIVHSLFIKLQ